MTTPEPLSLPLPVRERWQPLRGGLLNVYRYDHEELWYEQGHLLLRGNNGTGKSRVLALQLPFLLDGEVASHRMEPDRDPAKRVEWNLLLGKHPERLGYTWLELGRRDAAGEVSFLTLGCGLLAVAGRGLTGKWLFVTDQRVGQDLFLQTPTGHALSKQRLVEALGERGEVFTTAAHYRAAVDRKLFHLGPERYEALVSLLIQLRQPQLSRKLDERKLSEALSEALAPLAPALLDDVAEALRGLDDDRLAVERLEAAHRGVEDFLGSYGRYTQIAARRRAERVRSAHAAYEATMRRLRAAEVERDEKAREKDEVEARRAELELAEQESAATVRTLESSPEMRDKKALDDARRLADERRAEADQARSALDSARTRCEARDREERDAAAAGAEAWTAVETELGRARRDAETVGLERDHDAAIAALALPEDASEAGLREQLEGLQEAMVKRRQAARLVADLHQAWVAAEGELGHAKERHAEVTAELDEAVERQREARNAVESAVGSLQDDYRSWVSTLRELVATEASEIAEELDEWARRGAGASPVAVAVRQAESAAVERLASGRADLEQRREAAVETLADLRAEQERLQSGTHVPPPAPPTRTPGSRDRRPGAPLWLLCDFAPEVADDARAAIEAALEASGLLDAWVTPDGRLLDSGDHGSGDHDTVLVPDSAPVPAEDRSLARILRPATDRPDPRAAAVDDSVVEDVLRQVGFGRGSEWAWVDDQGRWQLGPLHGSWAKPAAQHLGASAREAERRRRLAELEREVAEAEAVLQQIESELGEQEERARRVRSEAAAAPSDDGVLRSLAEVDAAAAVARQARDRLALAEARVTEKRRRATEARSERDEAAGDLGLGSWLDRLPALEEALGVYPRTLASLWSALHVHVAARLRAGEASERSAEARRDLDDRLATRHEAEARARRAAAERDTLQETVGAAVEEILARLEAARARTQEVRGAAKECLQRLSQLAVACAVAQKDIEREGEYLEREAGLRDEGVAALGRFVVTRLLSVAVPDLDGGDPRDWSTTRAVEVARRIESGLTAVLSDDAAWERSQRDILQQFSRLNDNLLEHGYQPYSTMEDNLFVVMVPFQGRDCTMTELRANLTGELAERQSILNAREREVIENHLIGEVATHLHERLRAGEEWVREMNDELADRPMSTGMALRFSWEPIADGPAGLAEARRRLLGVAGTWSPEDRTALGDFLQEQIRSERAKGEGTWREQLAAALDYRTWHRFSVERRQDGQWKRLTRRTHGTGSGGEKAIALTIPQFAAAAAHYRTAHPWAPRLILLDEAFVGVDADMRAKCMGLLHAFDLDFVMTSEREWGCYATLPGVAIYHLSTRPGIDAVGLSRWVWNGSERVSMPHVTSPASSS